MGGGMTCTQGEMQTHTEREREREAVQQSVGRRDDTHTGRDADRESERTCICGGTYHEWGYTTIDVQHRTR